MCLSKYIAIIKIGWQQDLTFRSNLIMWRIRNISQILIAYFLWSAVFGQKHLLFGYTKEKMLTYILLSSLIRSIVFSSRTIDLAGQIQSGELTNLLLKPISSIKYFFTRDISDKILNISFSLIEISLLIIIFQPMLFINHNLISIILFIVSSINALILYFFIDFLFGLIGFWSKEVWAPRFLFFTTLSFLAGSLFPLDILPQSLLKIIRLTPFPHFLFYPSQILLNKISISGSISNSFITIAWIIILHLLSKSLWRKGLQSYEAHGH